MSFWGFPWLGLIPGIMTSLGRTLADQDPVQVYDLLYGCDAELLQHKQELLHCLRPTPPLPEWDIASKARSVALHTRGSFSPWAERVCSFDTR